MSIRRQNRVMEVGSYVDRTERRYFNSLPTRLKLPRGAADRLREVAGRLLRQSPAWQNVLPELNAEGENTDSVADFQPPEEPFLSKQAEMSAP